MDEVVEEPLKLALFRLVTGEDIISTFTTNKEQGIFRWKHPLKLILRRVATGETGVLLIPWLPEEIILPSHNMECVITVRDVLTLLPVRPAMQDFYLEVVRIMEERIKRNDERLNDNLTVMKSMYSETENRTLADQMIKDYEDHFGDMDDNNDGIVFN